MKNLFAARVNFPLLKSTLVKQKNLLVIFTILLSITFPFTIVVRIISRSSTVPIQDLESTRVLLYFFTVILLLLIPFIFFNYLTSKRSVDFMHSLPIKRRDLYATFVLLSLLFVIIPFTIAYWSGYFLLYGFEDVSFSMSHIYQYVRSILLFGSVQASTLFVIMNTGTTSDSIIYSMILFIAPFIVYGAFEIFASTYIVGVESFGASNLLLYLSPTIALAEVAASGGSGLSPNLILLYWLSTTFVAHALTMRLYENWKSERSELPFNNRFFFYFVTSIFVAFFMIFSLSIFSIDTRSPLKFLAIQNLLLPILMSFILYVSLDTIRQRSFRKITKSIKRFSAIAFTTLLITTIVYVTQGFGYSNDLPDFADVDSIMISSSAGYSDPVLMGIENTPLKMYDETEIKLVLDMHQNLIDSFKQSNRFFNSETYQSKYYPIEDPYDQSTLQIHYQLKNGKKFKRTYYLPRAMNELTYPLIETQAFKQAKQPLFRNKVNDVTLYNGVMTQSYDIELDTLKDTLHREYFTLPLDQALSGEYTLRYVLTYTYDDAFYQIFIDDRYPETLKLLSELPEGKQSKAEITYVQSDNSNFGIAYGDYFDFLEEKKELLPEAAEALSERIRAFNLNGKSWDYLWIEIPNDYSYYIVKIPVK